MNYCKAIFSHTACVLSFCAQTLLIIIICCSLTINVFSQKTSQLEGCAIDAIMKKDYSNAAVYYGQLLLRDSTNINYLHGYAVSCFYNFNLKFAENSFKSVLNIDEKKIYPDDLFYYAQTLKMLGKYKQALKEFEKYYRRNRKVTTEKTILCKIEMDGCIIALKDTPLKLKVEILDSNINSTSAENSAFFFQNNLFFTTKKDSVNYAVYKSKYDGEKFGTKQLIKNLSFENASTSNLFMDGDRAYFTKYEVIDGKKESAIYAAQIMNDSVLRIEKISGQINLPNYSNTQATIGVIDNQKYLFFSSERLGSKGGMDIYQSKINDDNSFEIPINLGSKINTYGDEITPFYCNECKVLYFSSNFHLGFGGFDIFRSTYSNGMFLEPENMGSPINSSLNDVYFSFIHEKKIGFLSSNRKGSLNNETEFCCNDIYKISMPDLWQTDSSIVSVKNDTSFIDSTQVAVDMLQRFLPLQLYFDNDEPDKKTLATTTDKKFTATALEYQKKRDEYVSNFSKAIGKINAEDAKLALNYFFEDSVSASISMLTKSFDLIKLVLQNGKKIKLTVKGYCSPLASTNYNKNLAKRRIKSVLNDLLNYDSGILKFYVQSNALVIDEVEIGELQNSNFISDNLNDVQNSVYSLKAALERKISIIKIEVE